MSVFQARFPAGQGQVLKGSGKIVGHFQKKVWGGSGDLKICSGKCFLEPKHGVRVCTR